MQRLSGRLQELNHRESLPRKGPHASTSWKIISLGAMSKLGYNLVQVVAYRLTVRPKKW